MIPGRRDRPVGVDLHDPVPDSEPVVLDLLLVNGQVDIAAVAELLKSVVAALGQNRAGFLSVKSNGADADLVGFQLRRFVWKLVVDKALPIALELQLGGGVVHGDFFVPDVVSLPIQHKGGRGNHYVGPEQVAWLHSFLVKDLNGHARG